MSGTSKLCDNGHSLIHIYKKELWPTVNESLSRILSLYGNLNLFINVLLI